MTFVSEFDAATRLLVHRACAPVTAEAVERCALDWFARLNGQTFHALWDLRGQPLEIDMEELTFGHKEHLDWVHHNRRGQRHAYLTDSRKAIFLARALKRRVKVEWDIFDDETLAREWLCTGDERFRRAPDPLAFGPAGS